MTNGTQTLCRDVFHLERGQHVAPLIICSVFTGMYSIVALWTLLSMCRVRGFFKRRYLFGETRIVFYLLITLFCLGRSVFSGMRVVFGGYTNRLTLIDTYVNTSTTTVHYSFPFVIAVLFYHYASTCLYSALSVLCVDHLQHVLYAYGLAVKPINDLLLFPKYVIYFVNSILHGIEILLGITVVIISSKFNQIARSNIHVFIAITSTYALIHAIFILVLFTFLIAWALYTRMITQDELPIIKYASMKQSKYTKICMVIIGIVLAFKLAWDISQFILGVLRLELCIDSYYILTAIVNSLCDFIPLIIVATFMTPRIRSILHTNHTLQDCESDFSDPEQILIYKADSSPARVISAAQNKKRSRLGPHSSMSDSSCGTSSYTYPNSIIEHYHTTGVVEDQRMLIPNYFSPAFTNYQSSLDQ